MQGATYSPDHLLAGRFRIRELVGVGHTAEVYLAFDESLSRMVVVKCLVESLQAYEDVRRTFRTRLVSAASLVHPHLARVLDGGQDDHHVFLVTEYLADGSLEDELRQGLVLPPHDVARLGRDLASGLTALHEHGFVHGELSPMKILIDAERAVKISDVVLAGLSVPFRSYSSGDDVRYFSPEQARGEVATPATDVYALATILFEVATGQRPFDGFTAEATLRARVTTPLPTRPELGTLDMVLALATLPDPTMRLTAQQFGERLSTVVADGDDFVVPRTARPTLLTGFVPSDTRTSVGFTPPSPTDIVGAAPTTVVQTPDVAEEEYGAPPTAAPSPRRRPGLLAVAAVLVLALIASVGAWSLGLFTPHHTLPSLRGLSVSQASTRVQADGLTINLNGYASSSTVPTNDIVSQSPAAGSSIVQGGQVTVVLSSGPKISVVTLPRHLIGATCTQAQTALHAVGIQSSCPVAAEVASTHVSPGHVVALRAGTTLNPLAVPAGSTVTLVVAKGTVPPPTTTTTLPASNHGPRRMPNVVGMTQAQVQAALHGAELYFQTIGPGHGTARWRHVVSSVPAAGTMVPWHSTVTLTVTER